MRSFLFQLGLLALLMTVLNGPTAIVRGGQQPATVGMVRATDTGEGPVFDRDFPDPSVIADGRRYYAFSTQTAWEPAGHVFPILVSRDLSTWSYVGDVFSAPPAWGRGDWWAPAVVKRNQTYFLYYSGYANSGMHCVAVATADVAAGPYTDHGPIACQDGPEAVGYIDASPLVAGGKGYLYFSVDGPDHHSISVMPLSEDMLGVAGPHVELLKVTESWERAGNGTVEGPSIFAWGSTYVMLYSGGDWRQAYGMGYAIATSPMGPFVKSETPLLRNGGSLVGPGGGSFFVDLSGRPWMAYHAWLGEGRALYMTPLSILWQR